MTIKTKLTHFLKGTFTKTPTVNVACGGGGVLSSAFNNKLKYLFTATLLVLSLDVSTVENTPQFNKAAYLDFSKPYTDNWNNPQNYLKKTTKQPPY